MVNAGIGIRMRGATWQIDAINLFDERVQQHVWGDVIARRITTKITYNF